MSQKFEPEVSIKSSHKYNQMFKETINQDLSAFGGYQTNESKKRESSIIEPSPISPDEEIEGDTPLSKHVKTHRAEQKQPLQI